MRERERDQREREMRERERGEKKKKKTDASLSLSPSSSSSPLLTALACCAASDLEGTETLTWSGGNGPSRAPPSGTSSERSVGADSGRRNRTAAAAAAEGEGERRRKGLLPPGLLLPPR